MAQAELTSKLEAAEGRAVIYQSGRFYVLTVGPDADLRTRITDWNRETPSYSLKQIRERFAVEAPKRQERVSAYGDLAWVAAINRVKV